MLDARQNDGEAVVGQTKTLTIKDIAFGGEGVGRSGEFVVFVPFTALEEVVEVEIVEVKKRFARARLLRVISPSPDRIEPQCPYFGQCGGCQYQHLAYPAQLAIKHKQIRDLFERIGGFSSAAIAPVIPCPAPYGYRNRIMVRSQWNKPKQALDIGFIRHDCGLVVDVESCAIAEPVLNEQLLQARANPPPKGGIKVVLRMLPEDWEVPRDSFFQNNFHLLPTMVETVQSCLASSGIQYLIDVYCGVGFLGISLANRVLKFAGVEVDQMAVRAARNNARTHGRTNGDFILGPAEALLPKLLSCYPPEQTALILDPPRTGCPKESLEAIRKVRPAQVIYVSCHPATLARDLNVLGGGGVFALKQVIPLDMFPQTQHVECIADLRLGSAS
jgi:tRNA/tmRNA/rRNA uracil-C5-methylase (TrmA/RlmC/RlmD family)